MELGYIQVMGLPASDPPAVTPLALAMGPTSTRVVLGGTVVVIVTPLEPVLPNW